MNLSKHARNRAVLAFSIAWGVSPLPVAEAQEQGLSRDDLIAAARAMIAEARLCALITLDESGAPRVRTMDPFAPEEDMVIWMGTNRNTGKVMEIRNDPRVTLHYMPPGAGGYVNVHGTVQLVDDPTEKAKRWKEEWAAYYADRDATYLLIKVIPDRIEILSYSRGIVGDPESWKVPSVEFKKGDY